MPKIIVKQADDKKLERVVPPYLRGKHRTTQRVRWAIEEAVQLHDTTNKARRKAS